MADITRPEDVPDDADPVCGTCKRPAAWDENENGWRHAEAADAVFCSILRGTPLIVEANHG